MNEKVSPRESPARVPTLEALPPRCHDCAFTVGTEANSSKHTRLKAELCIEGLEPFYCHIRKGLLCLGWAERVIANSDAGYYSAARKWKRELALKLLDLQSESEERQIPMSEEEAVAAVAHIIEQLG